MNQETLIFGDIKMDKSKFHYPKNLVLIDELYIEKVLIFNRFILVKRAMNTLLVINMIIIKLRHCP